MKPTSRIKAYTERFGLVTSIPIRDKKHLQEALIELSYYTKLIRAYLTTGTKSSEITFTYLPQFTRPIYYTRPDGVKIRTLSIHPKHYPLVAHYLDGTTKNIK